MKRKLSSRVLYVAVGVFLVAYAAFGWFVLVGPKRAALSELKAEAASTESTLATARAAVHRSANEQPLAVADIFRLATAMPATPDMPGILLELSRLAEETGIEFDSVSPQASTEVTGFQEVPISLVFSGNFYELSDFLFRLRTLVGVRSGELHATGRLFSVESLNFAEAEGGFPDLTATLAVNAFVFGTAVAANTLPSEPAPPLPSAAPPAEPSAAAEASP